MNRIDRLTAILIQLQSRKLVRAIDIAERFDISPRTVYRDIKALEEAGVPIGAEAGKGYYILEGYNLPPVMFTKDEASALLIAEKFMEKLSDKSLAGQYSSALEKIRSILRYAEKEHLENLEKNIWVSHYSPFSNEEPVANVLLIIQNALSKGKMLILDYQAAYSEEFTKCRKVEPVGLYYYGLHWHLIAYCKMRKDYRDFRVDRLKKISILDESLNPINRKDLKSYIENYMKSIDLIPVTLEFPIALKKELSIQKYYHGWVSEEETGQILRMHFLVNPLDYIARWIISLGMRINIIAPPELMDIVSNKVRELRKYFAKI